MSLGPVRDGKILYPKGVGRTTVMGTEGLAQRGNEHGLEESPDQLGQTGPVVVQRF